MIEIKRSQPHHRIVTIKLKLKLDAVGKGYAVISGGEVDDKDRPIGKSEEARLYPGDTVTIAKAIVIES